MSEFLGTAFGFPTALFSLPLLVVAGYWVLVLASGLGVDVLDADVDTGADMGGEGAEPGGVLAAAGLGGVPVTVVLSVLIAVGWLMSLVGAVLVDGTGGTAGAVAVLALALGAAWASARLLVMMLRPIFRDGAGASRQELVGRMCVIRTGRVGTDFGQAEVIAPDGSSVLVQVRRPHADPLALGVPVAGTAAESDLVYGSTALIFDYQPVGECFLVMPYDAELDPDGPLA